MISVCLATFNGQEFIERQLDSIIEQVTSEDEIIIVDDGSNDRTIDLIKAKYSEQVFLHINTSNLGPIKSFEKAISLATGDYIFLCDQDDIWLPNKVQVVIKAFKEQKADIVVHDAQVVDGNLKELSPSWNIRNKNKLDQTLLGNIKKNAFTGCMMAFSQEMVPLILPFPDSIEMHDQWIALVGMIEKKKIVSIDNILMKYVRHGSNVTAIKSRSLKEQLIGRTGTLRAVLQYKYR